MAQVDDGIIKGGMRTPQVCKVCGKRNIDVVWVEKFELPDKISKDTKLIVVDRFGKFIRRVGIGCGCYARFHRQIAHIQDGQRTRQGGH